MRPFGFFMLEKGDPLCGVMKPSEELEGIIPRVCWPTSPVKTSKKVINRKFDSNMVQVAEVP